MDMSSSKLWELMMDREAWHAAVHGAAKSRTRLSDWTELNGPTPIFWPGEFHGLYSRWGHKESDRTEWLSLCNWLYLCLGFPGGSAGKEATCNAGDPRPIPGLGRSSWEANGYPHQYSGLENSMDCIVHGVAESNTTKWPSLSLSCSTKGNHFLTYNESAFATGTCSVAHSENAWFHPCTVQASLCY